MYLKSLVIGLVIALATMLPPQAAAQSASSGEVSTTPVDPFGRVSPRGTVDGYLRAMREADPAKAALFLDTQAASEGQGRRLATQLKKLLDDGGYFFLTDQISASPEGNLADEMSADLEEVGVLRAGGRDVPLILQRLLGADGSYIWLFSNDTVQQVPVLAGRNGGGFLDQILPQQLKEPKVMTVPLGHWLAMCAVAAFALIIGWWVARLILGVVDRLTASKLQLGQSLDVHSVIIPLAVVIGVNLYRESVIQLGVQVVARGATDWIAVTILWLAVAVLCLKLIDLVAEFLQTALEPEEHRKSLAALILLRKVAKAIIITVLTVQILEILGFDVTTAIAALGIGGLALALGAQKTVENLVGSVNVVADRPVEVGDFCKFGDVSGTVEDIGIRSTKIRTPGRTIVTVPNGVFASMQIENFSVRDQFLFNTTLSLRGDTPSDKIRLITKDLRDYLEEAEDVASGARVNLVALTTIALEIELYCYVDAPDYVSFLSKREVMLLFILATVSKTGVDYAFPPQRFQLEAAGSFGSSG